MNLPSSDDIAAEIAERQSVASAAEEQIRNQTEARITAKVRRINRLTIILMAPSAFFMALAVILLLFDRNESTAAIHEISKAVGCATMMIVAVAFAVVPAAWRSVLVEMIDRSR